MSKFTYSMPCGGKAVVTADRNELCGQWCSGRVDLYGGSENLIAAYNYVAKVFDEPGENGIRNGRVSKLQLNPVESGTGIDSAVANYDRGWEVAPDPMSNASWAVEVILLHYSDHGASKPDDERRSFRALFSVRNSIDGMTTFHERHIDAFNFDDAMKIANGIVADGFKVESFTLSRLYEF